MFPTLRYAGIEYTKTIMNFLSLMEYDMNSYVKSELWKSAKFSPPRGLSGSLWPAVPDDYMCTKIPTRAPIY